MRDGLQREDLFRLYEHHLAEYRFQVQLNWQRTQYLLALNLAVLAAAAGILRLGDRQQFPFAGLLFLAGSMTALLALLVVETQRGYYRAAREGKLAVERELRLGRLALRTTPAMGSGWRRLLSVHRSIRLVLTLLFLLNVGSLVYVAVSLYTR